MIFKILCSEVACLYTNISEDSSDLQMMNNSLYMLILSAIAATIIPYQLTFFID